MAQLLVDVTPFRPTIKESKSKPGVFEVEGVMQRADAKNQNGRTYDKDILKEKLTNICKSSLITEMHTEN